MIFHTLSDDKLTVKIFLQMIPAVTGVKKLADWQNYRVAVGRRKSVRLYINVIEKTDTTPQSFTYDVASGKILPVPG